MQPSPSPSPGVASSEAGGRAPLATLLATMGHDLRTPLNAIIGFSELLQEEVREAGHEGWLQDLEQIRVSGRQLLELLNPIIDLAKIESRRVALDPEPVDLATLGREVAAAVEPALAAKGGALSVRGPAPDAAPVLADAARLCQCVVQLIRSVAEIGEAEQVSLEISGTPAGPGGAPPVFGSGRLVIRAACVESVAQSRDPRLPSWSGERLAPGPQLGLLLANRLSELMGFKLELQSGSSSSAAFVLVIPGRPRPGGDRPGVMPER
jgi:light-regulated signal transduction histidine kinase (bacteriophytochrome)